MISKNDIYNFFDQAGLGVKGFSMSRMRLEFHSEHTDVFKLNALEALPIKKWNIEGKDVEELYLEYIFDTTNTRIESISKFGKFRNIDHLPFVVEIESPALAKKWEISSDEHYYAQGNVKFFYLAFKKIPGSLTIKPEDQILSLGNIEEIDGELGLIESVLHSLGNLKRVSGDFWVSQSGKLHTNLTSLGILESIGGSLFLKKAPIKDLGNLKRVTGNLNLRETNIESLGNLEFVGGNVLLPKVKRDLIDLSKITVLGKVKYFRC